MSGATGKCKDCGGATVCVIGNYWACKLCDSPHRAKKVAEVKPESWEAPASWTPVIGGYYIPPGIMYSFPKAVSAPYAATMSRYKCMACADVCLYSPDAVANGQTCDAVDGNMNQCGGVLVLAP